MLKCDNGHQYNEMKHYSCPFCGVSLDEKTFQKVMKLHRVQTGSLSSYDKELEIINNKSLYESQQKTVSLDDKTVVLDVKSTQE